MAVFDLDAIALLKWGKISMKNGTKNAIHLKFYTF